MWGLQRSPEEVTQECSGRPGVVTGEAERQVCLQHGGRGWMEDASWPNAPGRVLGNLL